LQLQESKKKRFERIFEYKQHMSRRIRHKFANLMLLRKFNGQILLDHKEKTLELEVIPRNGNHANTVCNTQSLSGGERSYSTVAFLIAMWTALDHPFFFLDEYDVFTDQVNRHVMTKLLLHEAESRPNRQYVFLTPQDMSTIDANEMITIHRWVEPGETNGLREPNRVFLAISEWRTHDCKQPSRSMKIRFLFNLFICYLFQNEYNFC
jgi:structural maintenance of chromosomes protein 6